MTQPSITQTLQYLKDFSFENFAASLVVQGSPAIELNVNIETRPLQEPKITDRTMAGDFEVDLILRATARPQDEGGKPDEEKTIFIVEIRYAGRYQIAGVPQAEVEPFLLIEAPRLLFPFARQIVADAVMQGGLPPFLIAPVDFMQIYQMRKAQQPKG